MKITRVFPTWTSFCPNDEDCYFDSPDLFTPHYDKAEICCIFTWDKSKAESLAKTWGDGCSVIQKKRIIPIVITPAKIARAEQRVIRAAKRLRNGNELVPTINALVEALAALARAQQKEKGK